MLILYVQPQIYTEVEGIIQSVEGLSAHIDVMSLDNNSINSNFYLLADNNFVYWPLNWEGTEPPLIFSEVDFEKNNLLALIMTKFGHFELIQQFQISDKLLTQISLYKSLIHGEVQPIPAFEKNDFESLHNSAVIRQYTGNHENGISLNELYELCLNNAPTDELRAFSLHQYVNYLIDINQIEKAETLLKTELKKILSKKAFHALQFDLVNLLIANVRIPYNWKLIEEIKEMITSSIAFNEEQGNLINLATLLSHASEIANISHSYSESLGYINRAIDLYGQEQIPEFLATAFLRKGTLLYTWAQSGNPQFYKTALETYQHALKLFRKDTTPDIFAEIHHNLGVIYAEIPADEKQRQIWAAISASSFKESLSFYTKENYPYEFAMVSNNYANALMKYPESKNGDNYERALTCFFDVLEVRTAKDFPMERAYTILNFLEACWRVNNVNSIMERVRLKDMLAKANEIKDLVDNKELIVQANEHIERLRKLNLMEVNDA